VDKINILWVDDEIDLLRPHVLFLEERGYNVSTVNNGSDALSMIEETVFDLVFLDEHMPGLSGLETLAEIKNSRPSIPVVMVTKSEEEDLMDEAIGSKISDYLIKPVNPNQILLSIKKNIDNKRLVSEKTTLGYQQEFRNISMSLNSPLSSGEWIDIYKKIVHWELELGNSDDENMDDILKMQKTEANSVFGKFIQQNYLDWLNGMSDDTPILSHTVFKKKVHPIIGDKPVFLFVIDNLRFDQWKAIQPIVNQFFNTKEESLYYSILPTATQYARNALFSGLLPSEIEKKYPELWISENDEGGKNMHEGVFLEDQIRRLGLQIKHSYTKVTSLQGGKKLSETIPNLFNNSLNIIVYNFVDMLSHARTEMEIIKELADDEAAYRSLTVSWFEHSPLLDALKQIAQRGGTVIITTDHGSIRVNEPSKVIGDRNTTTNLRYKSGKSLTYNKKHVFEVKNPEDAFLPRSNVSFGYIFAKSDTFFVYPNNYNYYVNFYRDSFQHGGVSLEEILIPFITLNAK